VSNETTYSLIADGVGPVEVTVSDSGTGHGYLLLHGGGGPQSVAGFANLLAGRGARVIAPTHPGFSATPRPDTVDSMAGLARVYAALLDRLALEDVTVIGNSIGGWIASEIALRGSPRIGSLVLVDAVGIEVAGHPIVDFFSLTLDQVAEFSYHDPDRFRIDPTAMSDVQRATMAGNRSALAVYGGATMSDPTLRGRLQNVAVPTLVIWGDSDRIADSEYGRAYAAAIPGATFVMLTDTGHMPQLETPEELLTPIWDFAESHAQVRRAGG
jgi:pimeloyl-ACP methyl ester carboxylesterase